MMLQFEQKGIKKIKKKSKHPNEYTIQLHSKLKTSTQLVPS